MRILLSHVRTSKGFSIAELSRRSGISVSHIFYIENCMRTPTITVLCKLARALNVKPEDLYSCDDN